MNYTICNILVSSVSVQLHKRGNSYTKNEIGIKYIYLIIRFVLSETSTIFNSV